MQERLAAIREPMDVCRALEADLIARIRRPLLIHPAIAYALRAGSGSPRVDQIQQRTGYSPRHFIELFHSTVGLTPKHFYRVQRFSSALTRLARGMGEGGARLADVASAAGYADQAHFSREFRELAGVAPSTYCPANATSEHHHVVLPGKKASRLVRRPA
jgi:AraC-like DNA-binding protein